LVGFRRPAGGFGDGHAAHQRSYAVAERHSIFGKPISKGSATALGYILGEACLKVEEQNLARL